jgi:hypothetical protein
VRIKDKRRKGGIVVEESHVCGGRCAGEGGCETGKVRRLSCGAREDVGGNDAVVAEDGVHDDLEVGDR